MEIRPPSNWTEGVEKEDGPPCVAASRFADAAIFRALVYDDWTEFGERDNKTLYMRASQLALDMARDHIGYVYVFNKKNFAPCNGDEKDMEWRSLRNEIPVKVIAVTTNDLPREIDIIPPEQKET